MADLTELETLANAAYPGPYQAIVNNGEVVFWRMDANSQQQIAFRAPVDASDGPLMALLQLMAHSWDWTEVIQEVRAARDQVANATALANRVNPMIEGVLRLCRENQTVTWSQVPVKIRTRLQELWQLFQSFESAGP
jgi:hypothetical protein